MAKRIRFTLEMDNGEANTLNELQQCFSLKKVTEHFENGKLDTWLRDRYLDEIADELSALSINDTDFDKQICKIFDVPYTSSDIDVSEENTIKLSKFNELNIDKKYLEVVNDIAFDQEDLYDLLDEDTRIIYLCGQKFSIPTSKKGIKYIGIGDVSVTFSTKSPVDLAEKNITFDNINFIHENEKSTTDNEENAPCMEMEIVSDSINDDEEDMESEIDKEQINELCSEVIEFLDEFIDELPDKLEETDLDITFYLEEIDSSDYENYEYDYDTKASAKSECKDQLKAGIEEMIDDKLDTIKYEMLEKFEEYTSHAEEVLGELIDEFTNAFNDSINLHCEGTTSEFATKYSEMTFSHSILIQKYRNINLDNNIKEMVEKLFDKPLKKLFVIKDLFALCEFDKDDDYYCYDLDGAFTEINSLAEKFIDEQYEDMKEECEEICTEVITAFCDLLKEQVCNMKEIL